MMLKWTRDNATITVDTDKEGALSAKGHRLRFEFEEFEIDYNDESGSWTVIIKAASIAYRGTIEGDEIVADGLSKSDQRKVLETTLNKVLKVEEHPYARYEAKLEALHDHGTLDGKMTVRGVTRPFTATYELDTEANVYVTQFTLRQSDFSIKPYSALMGAIRVSDDLRVTVRLEKLT